VFETHALSGDNENGIATGYVATCCALEYVTRGRDIAELTAGPFEWQAHGWEYVLG
jgi:hypothetical protein